MNSKQKQIIAKLDNGILSQEKLVKKLKKYPEQKTKISFMNLFSLELENKTIVDAYEKYSQLSKFVKVKKLFID